MTPTVPIQVDHRTREFYLAPDLSVWMPRATLAGLVINLTGAVVQNKLTSNASFNEWDAPRPRMMLALLTLWCRRKLCARCGNGWTRQKSSTERRLPPVGRLDLEWQHAFSSVGGQIERMTSPEQEQFRGNSRRRDRPPWGAPKISPPSAITCQVRCPTWRPVGTGRQAAFQWPKLRFAWPLHESRTHDTFLKERPRQPRIVYSH